MKNIKQYQLFINENYFNDKISDRIKKFSKKYVGKNVTWYGDPEQMVVLNPEQVYGMYGNVYDSDKLENLVNQIKNADENIELECSYGFGYVVDFGDICEHQEAFQNDRFDIDFNGHKNPYTIGDEELDSYIGNDYYIKDEYQYITDIVQFFFIKNKFEIAEKTKSENDIREEFMKLVIDSDDVDSDIEALEEFIDIENQLKESIENNEGDLNKFKVQLRDGHHRVMGAIEAGENNVCVNLAKGEVEIFKDYL